MKNSLIIVGIAVMLAGCVVAPIPTGRVVVQPSVQISYVWDPYRVQYYYVERDRRIYMPREWHHPGDHGHRRHGHWDRD